VCKQAEELNKLTEKLICCDHGSAPKRHAEKSGAHPFVKTPPPIISKQLLYCLLYCGSSTSFTWHHLHFIMSMYQSFGDILRYPGKMKLMQCPRVSMTHHFSSNWMTRVSNSFQTCTTLTVRYTPFLPLRTQKPLDVTQMSVDIATRLPWVLTLVNIAETSSY